MKSESEILGWTIPRVEPTDDPEWFRTVEPCEETCAHPVHAFGHPERLRHLIDSATVRTATKFNAWDDVQTA